MRKLPRGEVPAHYAGGVRGILGSLRVLWYSLGTSLLWKTIHCTLCFALIPWGTLSSNKALVFPLLQGRGLGVVGVMLERGEDGPGAGAPSLQGLCGPPPTTLEEDGLLCPYPHCYCSRPPNTWQRPLAQMPGPGVHVLSPVSWGWLCHRQAGWATLGTRCFHQGHIGFARNRQRAS